MKRPLGSSQTITKPSRPYKKRRSSRPKGRKPTGTPEMYTPAQVFPDVLKTTLRYNSNMIQINPSAASVYYSFDLNAMYDFDFDNLVGNKQPLYFDELLTVDGPYRTYTCKKWVTKIHIINASGDPLICYWSQGSAVNDSDTLIEVQNKPNVRELILTQNDGGKNSGTIVAPGSINEIYGKRLDPSGMTGHYTSNPASLAKGTLYLYNPGGVVTTPVRAWVKITHDFIDVELGTTDAIIS